MFEVISITDKFLLLWVLPSMVTALLFFAINRSPTFTTNPIEIEDMGEQEEWGFFWLLSILYPAFYIIMVIASVMWVFNQISKYDYDKIKIVPDFAYKFLNVLTKKR